MTAPSSPSRWPRRGSPLLPPPASAGGLAILGGIILGAAYLLLFVAEYSALSAEAAWVVGLSLLLAVVVTLILVSMIAADRARATEFELDFARTSHAHLAAGETLTQSSPLGGILSEYARAGAEQRRLAREHSYAASLSVYATGFALLGTLLVGLGIATGPAPNVIGVGMFFEWFAFILLGVTAGSLVLSVGRSSDVVGFDVLVLRRWTGVARPSFPFTHALAEAPWAAAETLPEPPAPWLERGA